MCNQCNYNLYKVFRILYCSIFYYFAPFFIILVPYASEYSTNGIVDRTQKITEETFFNEAADGYMDLDQFKNFITTSVCVSSIENESVLRNEDIWAVKEWTTECVQNDPED